MERERNQEEGLPRTNNQLESWQNAFQGSTETFHPSVFRFIEALQREEALERANLIQIKHRRDIIIIRVKRYVAVNDRITIVQQNRKNYAGIYQFLQAIAHNFEINVA